MNWKEAFEVLRAGGAVKRPNWGGYWKVEGDTIMMHCKDGRVVDIRNPDDVMFTLENIAADDWQKCGEAIDEAKKATMSFGSALRALKDGKKVARKGWNGKGMYLWLVPESNVKKEWCHDKGLLEAFGDKDEIHCNGHIRMYCADGSITSGWLASQVDMLSEDWVVVC